MTKFFLNLVCIFWTQEKLPKALILSGEREFIRGYPYLNIAFNLNNIDGDFQSAIGKRNQQLVELFSRKTGLILLFYFCLALLLITNLIWNLNLASEEFDSENLFLLIYTLFALVSLLVWQYPSLHNFVARIIGDLCIMQSVYISFLLSNTNESNLTQYKGEIESRITNLAKLARKKPKTYIFERYMPEKTKKYFRDIDREISREMINLNLQLSSRENIDNIREKFLKISKAYVMGFSGEILPILRTN